MTRTSRTRTVSLRYAHGQIMLSAGIAAICFAILVLALATGRPALLIFPVAGLVLSLMRVRHWARAIRRARTNPDAYRWTP